MIAITLLFLGLGGFVLWRLPRTLLRRYCAAFRTRHGLGVQLGLTVLVTATLSMVLATALRPGHGLMEFVDALVVGGLVAAGLVDIARFSRR
ncbi:MAG: hypothetical protein IT530_12290 [Burkholderiales bacterium]|nr:hypothetical protein [Burkholderiales bacterium]